MPATPAVDAIWTRLDFDPAAHGFTSGTASLGYEGRPADRVNFTGHFDTTLPAGPHAVYARIAFSLEDASAVASLQLRLKYDNGFIAYLNGVRVAEDNAPSVLGWSATAPSGTRRDADALEYAQFDLSAHRTALVDGENVLALHGLNSLSDSHDMLLVPELTVGASDLKAAVGTAAKVGYIATPSPGSPNPASSEIFAGIVSDTSFSLHRGFYDTPQQLEIATDTPGARIYYTTDGSVPGPQNGSAMLYTGPLTIGTTTTLRAVAIKDDYLPTNVDTQTYIFVDDVVRQDMQTTLAAGFPTSWGGTAPDYGMDPAVVNSVGAEAVRRASSRCPPCRWWSTTTICSGQRAFTHARPAAGRTTSGPPRSS